MNSMHKLSCVTALLLVTLIQPAISVGQNSDFDKKIGENRQKADTTRAEVARQIDEREAKRKEKLEARREEVRQWTKTQFEIGEREVIDKPAMMAPRLQQWQTQRDNEVFRLLNFREKSVGGIESGKALNTLLGRIGSAALENSEARKLNPLYGVPLYGATAEMQVNNEMLRKLSWEQNLLGAKSSGAFNKDPGDVEWPQILRDERWAESRHAVEEARARVLDELKAGRGVTTDLEKALCNAIATLNSDYAQFSKQWIKNPPPVASRPEEYRRLCNGKRHIEKLINTTYQLVDATEIADVAPVEKFQEGNIEDFLAYMQRNNLQFSPATKGPSRTAYYQVFNLMVRYYLDLKAVTNAEREIDREIERIDRIEEKAIGDALASQPIINLVEPADVKVIEDLIAQ